MAIFQDVTGLPVKFFIQKDLPQEAQAELCETITSLGGRVEIKVPRQGFILVQPHSSEEERLRQCWLTPDRPNRFVVPYTYVEACKISGKLLKQIFIEEDNQPIRMHVHASIANPNARNLLRSRIMHSGGYPDSPMRDSRVILADPNTEVFQHLVKTYQGRSGKHIESYLWVKKCIENGTLAYTPVIYKNAGGRRPGDERRQFTAEDENNLCQWIAEKIPYKETGGRTGNRLYQQLCEQTEPEYQWVKRHTWQSWRERYKKHALRLDEKIGQIVSEKRIAQGEQGQIGYIRQPEEKPKRTRKKRTKAEEIVLNDDQESTNTAEELAQLSALPMSEIPSIEPDVGLSTRPPQQVPFQSIQPPPSLPLPPSHTSIPLPPEVRPSPANLGPDEEEMDDNEESQWVVREGNEPPPAWTKRKADDNPGHTSPNKRHKSGGENMTRLTSPMRLAEASPIVQATSTQINTSALVAFASMHVIDQSLREIAKDYRFTLEEVQEFYDRCGEMGRTRQRFQLMRKLLAERFPDDL